MMSWGAFARLIAICVPVAYGCSVGVGTSNDQPTAGAAGQPAQAGSMGGEAGGSGHSDSGPEQSGGAGGEALTNNDAASSAGMNQAGEGGAGGAGGAGDFGGAGAGPSLFGGQVRFAVHCCSAPPSDANLYSSVATATIGPGVEFPAIASMGSSVINADVDVSDGLVTIIYRASATAYSGTFNGYELDFVPTAEAPSLPLIDAASLDAATTFSSGVGVSFSDHSLFINMAGLSIPAGSEVAVRFSLRE